MDEFFQNWVLDEDIVPDEEVWRQIAAMTDEEADALTTPEVGSTVLPSESVSASNPDTPITPRARSLTPSIDPRLLDPGHVPTPVLAPVPIPILPPTPDPIPTPVPTPAIPHATTAIPGDSPGVFLASATGVNPAGTMEKLSREAQARVLAGRPMGWPLTPVYRPGARKQLTGKCDICYWANARCDRQPHSRCSTCIVLDAPCSYWTASGHPSHPPPGLGVPVTWTMGCGRCRTHEARCYPPFPCNKCVKDGVSNQCCQYPIPLTLEGYTRTSDIDFTPLR